MRALGYLIETLLQLALLAVLLRLVLQWARADFRNPLARAVVQLTNPVLVPLRRLLPSVGRIDTASIVVVLMLAAAKVCIPWLLAGSGLPPALNWAAGTLAELVRVLLYFYLFAILIYALASFLVPPGSYSPAQMLLHSICEPILGRIRRVIPPLANLDFSPLWALIAIQALLLLLPR